MSTENEATEIETKIETPVSIAQELPSLIDYLPENLVPYWQIVQKYPIIESAIIIVFFYLIAYIIRRYVLNLINRITSKSKTDIVNDVTSAIKKPLFKTVVWLGILIATTPLNLGAKLNTYITPIILTVIIIIWLKAFMRLSSTIFTTMSRDQDNFKNFDVRTEPLLIITSKLLILIAACFFMLNTWGINPVGLLASLGVVGVAVGFAAKDTLGNLFSGIFILADRPYSVNDYITLDNGDRGKVTYIGIRSTRILTRDDVEITIPNGIIGNAKVSNESGGPHSKMRIRALLQCAYDADLEEVCNVLMDVAENSDLCDYPAPRVRVRGFGESGIDVQLLGWIEQPELRGAVTHKLYMDIHQAFKDKNLEIPYPRREIEFINQVSNSNN